MAGHNQDILDRRYWEVYEALYTQLEERKLSDASFTPEDVRAFLKDAYVRQGNDWMGHGALWHATQAATIAAHEAFLAEWESEAQGEGSKD